MIAYDSNSYKIDSLAQSYTVTANTFNSLSLVLLQRTVSEINDLTNITISFRTKTLLPASSTVKVKIPFKEVTIPSEAIFTLNSVSAIPL